MTREEQISNGFTEMMKGFWENQDLKVPDFEEPCKQDPCEDCVSREAVKDILHKSKQKAIITFEDFEELVNKLPSVTPQQKVGKWISVENEEMETVGYYCSECDLPMETEQRTKFCPNCGTKMEVSENE